VNNFDLKGFWDEANLSQLINIQLKICSNSSSTLTNNKGSSCKTIEEIKTSLAGKTFNIFYKDVIVDMRDYENSFKSTGLSIY